MCTAYTQCMGVCMCTSFGISYQMPLALAPPPTAGHPEVVEDFVRNFLVEMGMTQTASCFQTEWLECMSAGSLP